MDALIKLYNLPNSDTTLDTNVYNLRRATPYEKSTVVDWIRLNFGQRWADESEACFNHQPVTLYVATRESSIVGFACYECTYKNFFGPMGVIDSESQKGIGSALALAGLSALRELGYAYAIIGGCDGRESFYQKVANAELISDSTPGAYFKPLN